MIEKVARMFQRRDPRREASMALARITSIIDMNSLPWKTGVYDDRRVQKQTDAALGVWLIEFPDETPSEELSFARARLGVCTGLRANGFGVLSSNTIPGERFIIAVPNGAESDAGWKFFTVNRRHNTPCPGGWHSMGLEVEHVFEPCDQQCREFADVSETHDAVH